MDTHQKVITAAVLLIVGLAGGFWLGRGATMPDLARWDAGTPTPAATPPAQGSVLVGANGIAVSDQAPGLSVAISMVALSRDGWVVIHESEEGKPGRILGAKRFDVGTGMTGNVELLRPTAEGQVYFAMLHADDGDRQFDHAKDLPLQDPAGNIVLMRFVTAATVVE
ncbi:MAG: hypothetical protein Q8R35_00905 [bacterium]|nr:hypothetical protein [bacterium]